MWDKNRFFGFFRDSKSEKTALLSEGLVYITDLMTKNDTENETFLYEKIQNTLKCIDEQKEQLDFKLRSMHALCVVDCVLLFLCLLVVIGFSLPQVEILSVKEKVIMDILAAFSIFGGYYCLHRSMRNVSTEYEEAYDYIKDNYNSNKNLEYVYDKLDINPNIGLNCVLYYLKTKADTLLSLRECRDLVFKITLKYKLPSEIYYRIALCAGCFPTSRELPPKIHNIYMDLFPTSVMKDDIVIERQDVIPIENQEDNRSSEAFSVIIG